MSTFEATLTFFSSCQKDDSLNSDFDVQLTQSLQALGETNWRGQFTFPNSDNLSAIPQDPKNPLTPEKVALGKLLYHETGIGLNPEHPSGEGTYSCASCHFASAGFQAGRWQGIGEGGLGAAANGMARLKNPEYQDTELDVQPIRSPSTLNTAYQRVMLWNGQFGATGPNNNTEAFWTVGTPKENNNLGYEGLETQAIAGLGVHRLVINKDALDQFGYTAMFDEAFTTIPEENRYTPEMAGLAIAAYERTLLATEAPFQKWLKGDVNAMSDQEKRGATLFFGKAQCAPCHGGPALSSESFHAFGMGDLDQCGEKAFNVDFFSAENKGRGGFTGRSEDNFKFKVPQLYNLGDSPFYGHGSTFTSIHDVVAYKNEGIKENERVPNRALSAEFQALGLSDTEVAAITSFIENALRDDNLQRYVPTRVLSGNCFPFADPISMEDMGCQ